MHDQFSHNYLNHICTYIGLHVTIDCKLETGEIKRVGDGELDEGGEFKISLLKEIILKKKCYAQLHNAAATPCPAHDGLDNTKIVIKSQTHNKITFTTTKTLRFSTALCTSKFLWPFFEYPPLPKFDPWKKKWPKFTIPPLENFGHPWILPPPYKPKPKFKPLPPPLPIYKPKPEPPVFKPLPPPLPIYKPKPKPPVFKPLPPPLPIYKPPTKPLPPPVPFYKPIPKPPLVKPLPPIYKPIPKPRVIKPFPPAAPIYKPLPPPVPIYEPPVVTKPLPPPFPLFPLPPLHKKPCPPITKIPPKLKHPKFGHFPKLPPFDSNP